MSDPSLQRRLRRIERLLYLVLAMLGGVYVYGFGVLVDFYAAAVLAFVLFHLVFAAIGVRSRRQNDADGDLSDA